MDMDGLWIDDLMAAIDRKDHEAFGTFLMPNARFSFGNAPPVDGIGAISETVAGFFSALKAIRHKIEDRWVLADTAIFSGLVTYTRLDGSTLQVPFANILKFQPAGVQEYLVYVDSSALFSP